MQYFAPAGIHEILKNRFPPWVNSQNNMVMNEAISFDIETTSTYYNGNKVAFMYEWTLDIFDCAIVGRTWFEFMDVINAIVSKFRTFGMKRRIVIYVHNLAYEFQFIRKWFKWIKVFSLSRRKPLYAITTCGIEFRCSYRLSGYNLAMLGEQMGIEKLGDFDYGRIRHSQTPLSSREIQYCIHDVKIVSAYIRQKIVEEHNDITKIPMTKTGYVRRHVREHTLRGNNRCFYKNAIKMLTLEPKEYIQAKLSFMGGFTHAGALHSGREEHDVTSKDLASSYPTVLVAEKFPMTKGIHIKDLTEEQFNYFMEHEECCIFTVELLNVTQIFPTESYISESRCTELEGDPDELVKSDPDNAYPIVVNNGRIVSAKRLVTNITSIDYNIIKRVYNFTLGKIGHFYIYQKYYLPTTFVECILDFFEGKTTLKDIKGKETEYAMAKANLNSIYGMTVTDIVRELVIYNDDEGWKDNPKRTEDEYNEFVAQQIDIENAKKSRFLFYLWGVFCTAYARKNLWKAIFHLKEDYIYSDTDSVKFLNANRHHKFFKDYNKEITEKLEAALVYHNIPNVRIRPMNNKGERKSLGVWEDDGEYKRFKAIRAKAYIYQDARDDSYHLTAAGLSKQNALEYMLKQDDPIEFFRHDMYIPAEYTGKLTHTYVDESFAVPITDYLGKTMVVSERSFIHLEPADYHLSLKQMYQDYLTNVHEIYD